MQRVRTHFVPVPTLALGLVEIILLSCAFYLFAVPGDGHFLERITPYGVAVQFSLGLAVLTILTMSAVGLYNQDAFRDYRAMLARLVLVFVLGAPIIIAAMLIYKTWVWPDLDIRTLWYVKALATLFVCVISTRLIFLKIADGEAFKRRVIVVGAGARARHIQELSVSGMGSQFLPVVFLASPRETSQLLEPTATLDDAMDTEALLALAHLHAANEIVVATDDRRGLPVRPLLGCKMRGVQVTEFLSFCERESGRVDLEGLQPSWLIFSDGFRAGVVSRAVKRIFDIVVSAATLALTLPLLAVTALLVKLADGGPILYSQERVGLFGKPFTLYKFRSMRVDAEPDGAPQWAAKGDARVTPIGAVIRKVRIDELPQLFNVLKGDMSFIGPRPERPYFVEQLAPQIPFYGERHAVKPGITGWAQINHPYGASLQDARGKLAFDLYYVKNHSLMLDLVILIQTVRVVLLPSGAR